MNRRFNYTGRTKIIRDAISIRVVDDAAGGPSRFIADLSGLSALEMKPTARVIVEPYVRQSSMRFDFGPLNAIVSPVETIMTEVDRGEVVQFRIKVVDTTDKPGRILALANQIRPADESEDDNRKAILPILSTDLGEAVWSLQVGAEKSPVLEINSRIPELRARLDDDPILRGAIFPIAIRETIRVLLTEDLDDETEWVRDWRDFAGSLIGEALPEDTPDDTAVRELSDRIVDAFCERERWATASSPTNVLSEADYE
jgi:hypothetical protein